MSLETPTDPTWNPRGLTAPIAKHYDNGESDRTRGVRVMLFDYVHATTTTIPSQDRPR